jgi:hypothetical protein
VNAHPVLGATAEAYRLSRGSAEPRQRRGVRHPWRGRSAPRGVESGGRCSGAGGWDVGGCDDPRPEIRGWPWLGRGSDGGAARVCSDDSARRLSGCSTSAGDPGVTQTRADPGCRARNGGSSRFRRPAGRPGAGRRPRRGGCRGSAVRIHGPGAVSRYVRRRIRLSGRTTRRGTHPTTRATGVAFPHLCGLARYPFSVLVTWSRCSR